MSCLLVISIAYAATTIINFRLQPGAWMFGTSSSQLLFHPQLPLVVLSSAAQEAAKSSKFDLTSYVPQQLQIFARLFYNIIMLQNNRFSKFLFEQNGALGEILAYIAFYEILLILFFN